MDGRGYGRPEFGKMNLRQDKQDLLDFSLFYLEREIYLSCPVNPVKIAV